METFVLIHGGWAGGWQWGKVVPLLVSAGHRVYTPTLSGMGERKHVTVPGGIRLSTHVEDVMSCIRYERLTGITLVGFSYGGMVATGTAALVPEDVRRIIYLDAFVPKNGQSLFDVFGPGITRALTAISRHFTGGDRVPFFDEDDPRLEDQPFLTGRERLFYNKAVIDGLNPVYVECTEKPPEWTFTPILAGIAGACGNDGWRTERLASDHFPMMKVPGKLVRCFQEIIGEGA